MNQEIKKKLMELAKRKTWQDDEDFSPYDYSGGNIDDAYYGGEEDGETNLARDLLKLLGNES